MFQLHMHKSGFNKNKEFTLEFFLVQDHSSRHERETVLTSLSARSQPGFVSTLLYLDVSRQHYKIPKISRAELLSDSKLLPARKRTSNSATIVKATVNASCHKQDRGYPDRGLIGLGHFCPTSLRLPRELARNLPRCPGLPTAQTSGDP